MKKLFFFLLFSSCIVYSNFAFTQSANLDTQELETLKEIWENLGLAGKEWGFDKDPCGGEGNRDVYVECDCSFESNTTCHVIGIGVVDTIRSIDTNTKKICDSSSGCERNWSVFEHVHSKKRNRLEQQKLNDLVYIKYNRALKRRYNSRDTIDPIILDDGNLQDPNEWLMGALEELEEDEENVPVYEGEDLTYGQVAAAVGADEPAYYTRRGSNTSKTGAKASTSNTSRPRGRSLIDEDDYDMDVEENDVAAYKDFVPTSDHEDDDEIEFEDLDDY